MTSMAKTTARPRIEILDADGPRILCDFGANLPRSIKVSQHLVYALIDGDRIRYIGCSSTGLARPRSHAHHLDRQISTPKMEWILALVRDGSVYTIRILEQFDSRARALEGERKWTASGRRLGWPLTNNEDHNRKPLDVDAIANAYRSGESENAIAARLGVARTAIQRRLAEARVVRRSMSESNTLRAAHMTKAERKANARAAHAARRAQRGSATVTCSRCGATGHNRRSCRG